MSHDFWLLRPAGSEQPGKKVRFARLVEGIETEEVGDLDEVRGPNETRYRTLGEHPRTADLFPAHRRSRTRRPEDAESDLTPMIDVTFQLVIFFMIAATYTVQKTLDLPTSQEDGPAKVTMQQLERDNIVVKIEASGAVTVQDEPVAVGELERHFRRTSRQLRTAELVLDVHDDALHETVVQVLDAAGAAQFETVLFVSRKTAN